jgi:signal transduction histidine kinase
MPGSLTPEGGVNLFLTLCANADFGSVSYDAASFPVPGIPVSIHRSDIISVQKARLTSGFGRWGWLLLFGAAIAGADVSAAFLAQQLNHIAAIWLANAIVVVVLLRAPARNWPHYLPVATVGLVAGELWLGNPIADALVFSSCNVLEILIVCLPFRYFGWDRKFTAPRNLLSFYLIAIGPATLMSSVLATTYLSLSAGAAFGSTFAIWYASAAMGLAAIVPIGMALRFRDLVDVFGPRRLPGTLALCVLMIAALLLMREFRALPLGFVLFPLFLLFTVARGYAGVAIAVLIASAATIGNLASSSGYLSVADMQMQDKLIVLQVFVGVLSATSVFFASVLAERRNLILQLKEAGEAAIAAKEAAEHTNKTKSNFLANMSHELRTPLNAILGYSEIMRDGLLKARCEGECREHSRIIHGAGSHLLSLINDVLDMSKIEAGKFDLYLERIEPAVALQDCVNLMEVRAEQAGVRLDLAVPGHPLEIMADGRALRQIVLNLLSNAIRFTPKGGSVSVDLRDWAGGVQICVRDTGIGIPARDLPRLGIPFEQVRRSADVAHSGTGLGLALVGALTQKHGGSMNIESEEGVGTSVTITLPAVVQPVPVRVGTAAAE